MATATGNLENEFIRTVRSRLRERLETLGITARKASIEAGFGPGAIGAILSTGKHGNRNPTLQTLERLAASLECDLAYLTGAQDTPRNRPEIFDDNKKIPVVGTVEAGVFTAMSGAEPWATGEHEFEYIAAPRSSTYPNAKHYGFRVRGDSMNVAKPRPILDGEIALFVDLIDTGLDMVDGRIYLIRRTKNGGETIEWTIKRARVYRDRVELIPESTNPVHKTFVIHNNIETDEEISAVGLLYAMHYSYEMSL